MRGGDEQKRDRAHRNDILSSGWTRRMKSSRNHGVYAKHCDRTQTGK